MTTIKSSITSTTAYQVVADTTGTLVFQTGAAPTTALTIGTDQSVTFAGAVSSTGNQTTTGNLTVNGNTTLGDASTDTVLMTGAPSIGGAGLGMGMGFRNRIINGAMVIDQRNAGASLTINSDSGKFSVDRWYFQGENTDGVFTVQQSSTAPTGFSKSMLLTVTTADASIGSSQAYFFLQSIEGFNIADLNWGTASAATITLSFWVYSSLTGTFGASVTNSAFNRSYPFTFAISSANTWEQKTVTIAGDTTGTWAKDNTSGMRIYFGVGVGSTLLGTANAWSGTGYIGASGQTNLISTNGATFYITGVQLEKGSTATSFDYRDYGRELIMCQRYYETTYPVGYAAGYNFAQQYPFSTSKPVTVNLIASDDTVVSQSIRYAVVKRTSPTVVIYSANDGASGFTWTYKGTGTSNANLAATVTYTSENLWNINQSLSAVNQANESYFHFTASAEL